jgi:hypothetical protein
VRALALAREAGLELRAGDGGTVRVLARPSTVPPPLLAALRAEKPGLLALLTGRACRRCGRAVGPGRAADRARFADGTASHEGCEDHWRVADAVRRARHALTPEALADPAELVVRGEAPP